MRAAVRGFYVGSFTLLDRLAERAALAGLLEAARAGHSGVLVVRGPAGVGKTALLEQAIEMAAGLRVSRVAGVESEMELAFAALQQLSAPMLDRLDHLPDPQRDALGVALGLRAGEAPDRFLVGLAALSLLSDAAADQPLLCVIDDAQWLDRASAQALAFVARRLLAEPVALIFAAREPAGELTGLPELTVTGLSDDDARALLGTVIAGPLDEAVRDRIIAETAGNPLALLELPHGLTSAQLAGGFGLVDLPALPGRIEDSFRQRLAALPADTRQLLLVAAADPTGEPLLLWRAAEQLGIDAQAAAAAEVAGLLTIGDRVTFRHPLVRSAVYRASSPEARRVVHCALAEVTDPRADPDRRAWHRAQAAPGPDEEVAGELEHSAARAHARGGYAAAAAFLQRSAALTFDPVRRAERSLAAAHAKYQAGAYDVALGLVAAAEAGPLTGLQRAQLALLQAQIAFASSRGSEAPPLLFKAARQFERLDMPLARLIYLDAIYSSSFAGRMATGGDMREVAQAARALPPPEAARPPDLLLDGLAIAITEGYAAAAPTLKQALSAFRTADISEEEGLGWLWQAASAAALLWDYESLELLSARELALTRKAGALTVLPLALNTRAGAHVFAGELAEAASLVAEAQSVTEATRSHIAPYGLAVAAFQGQESEAFELIDAATKDVQARGGYGLTFVQWATAVLCNSLGRYEAALAAAQDASEDSHAIRFANWALAELIEAATRTDMPERAAGALRRLTPSSRASGTDWALGIEARSRALVSDGEAAEHHYRRAIDHLARTQLRVELGRAHLLYGEWLRRERRRRDARDQLRAAHEIFDAIGAAAFAGRARAELRATGEHARKRTVEAHAALTAQETLIARLAGEGASNPQIAGQLFISPATVAYHLRKVFAKLDVSSRHQLARALPGQPVAAPLAPRRG